MDIPDDVLCLFSAQIEAQNGTYRINISERELTLGDLESGAVLGFLSVGALFWIRRF